MIGERDLGSGSGKWFPNADIVATILILERKGEIQTPDPKNEICFEKINNGLDFFTSSEEKFQQLIDIINLDKNDQPDFIGVNTYELERISSLEELGVTWNALFADINWLDSISSKLVPITDYFDVIRGERRGWDSMFYPSSDCGVELEYLKPVLLSSRKVPKLVTEPNSRAFCCSLSIEELERKNHKGALSWISRFENGTNKTGKPLPESLKRSDLFWYEMKDTTLADLFYSVDYGDRLFVGKLRRRGFINQRLIGLRIKKDFEKLDLFHALLNSSLGLFYIEALGFGRGLGALDLNSQKIHGLRVLNAELLSNNDAGKILDAFKPLLTRNIKTVDEELNDTDRINFDNVVFSAFGIQEWHNNVTSSLMSLYKMRASVR